jgi:hypothetical protein
VAAIEARPFAVRRVLVGGWLVTRAVLLLGMILGHSYCDPQFYNYAGQLAAGRWPYRDFAVEYPPLAMALLLLPAVPLLPFSSIAPRPDPAFTPPITHIPHPDPLRYGAYGISFALMLLAIDAATLWLVCRAARRHVPGDKAGLRSGLLYIALVFLSGAALQKFDLVAGTLCLVALLALVEDHDAAAWGAVALATLVKGFPLLLLPILIGYRLYCSRRAVLPAALRSSARALRAGMTSFATILAGCTLLVVLVAGVPPLLHTLTYHTDRGTEIESLYANGILALGWLPGLAVSTAFHAADLSRVVHSRLEPLVAPLSLIIVALFLLAVYLGFWRAVSRGRSWQHLDQSYFQLAATGICATLLAFLLAFRALPAHYLLDVLPVACLIRLPQPQLQRVWLVSLCLVAIAGQMLTVSGIWHALVIELQPWAVLLLSLRNLAWMLAFGALILALWQWPRRTRGAMG